MSDSSHHAISEDALAIWKAGVAAVDARTAVARQIQLTKDQLVVGDSTLQRERIDRVIVVGAGKASGWMAAGFEDAISKVDAGFLDRHVIGHVNVPDDQEISLRSIKVVGCRPAGENLPGPRVLAGTQRILELVRGATPRDLVIFMVAGGGSALLEQPVDPVTLDDFRVVTTLLSSRGANISQLNSVRRAISQVKAGGLARACNAGHLVSLIVSDVIGDPLHVIASGPTVLDSDSDLDPMEVLRTFDPKLTHTPQSVLDCIETNQSDEPDAPPCEIRNHILCNNQTAVAAAKQKAIELGYEVVRAETSDSSDDAEFVGAGLSAELQFMSLRSGRRCLISGGEPTVQLGPKPGNGGRNQHLALAAMDLLPSSMFDGGTSRAFCLLSGGTDGEDGNVPVAGAWFDSSMTIDPLEVEIAEALESFNSYSIWDRLGSLIRVPPTRTNVCDLRVILTENRA